MTSAAKGQPKPVQVQAKKGKDKDGKEAKPRSNHGGARLSDESQIQGEGGTLELADATFGAEFNEPLVHQVVTAYLAAGRAGTKAQKTAPT